jgi:hypothetical protein
MPETDTSELLYQSFLRGYFDSASRSGIVDAVAGLVPCAALIQAASVESKELRRSIDACRAALAQMPSLPETEQAQLKDEARGSLQALQAATSTWLARLAALRPADYSSASPVPKATPPQSARPRKNRPRR